MTLVQQRQRCLHINNSNNAIMTRSTIAIATTAKILAHQWQQLHHIKDKDISLTMSNKGNDACVRTNANEHIICLCLHAPLKTYYMFELASQLSNLAYLSSQASWQNLPTFAVGKCMTNENGCAMTFAGDKV
jgi:hypothetical protein